MKHELMKFGGFWWMKITPPWIKGYRPASTYRKLYPDHTFVTRQAQQFQNFPGD